MAGGSTTAAKAGFRLDIQGLRAVAVAAVVLYHSGVPFITGGYVGVDVFFVISGFLITSHLISGLRATGRVDFGSFYARRIRRILPASFVVLALSILAAVIWYPPLLMREVWAGAVATAFYIPNYLFAWQGTDYLAETTPSLFQHYWSLGIEEQFYLIWPLVLAAGFAFVKRTRTLFMLLVALVGVSFVACVILTFRSQPWAFFGLPTRAWELGVGGIVAFLLSYRPKLLSGPLAAAVGWAGVGGIVASAALFTSATPFPGYWAAIPVLSTAAVILAGDSNPRFGPAPLLSVRPMLFIGLISYSLYLVHWPLLQVPQAAVGFENPLPLWVTLLLGAFSVPVAWAMYRFVEQPARTGKWLAAARPRRSLLSAGAASVVLAVAATGAFAYSNALPLHSERVAASADPSIPPAATAFVPANLSPTLRAAADDQPIIYADGCHLNFNESEPADCVYGDPSSPRIVLFGDSHAAQWFPALSGFAETSGYAVESHTKSSCPSISADVLRDGVPYVACSQWRDAVIDRINAERPALVVIANYGRANLANDDDSYGDAWGAALQRTIDAIDVPTVVLADTPDLGTTPSVCLSANLDSAESCGKPRERALESDARVAEKSTTAASGVPYVDLTDYMCSSWCYPIIGDVLAYRDSHHITARFSETLAPALGSQLAVALSQP